MKKDIQISFADLDRMNGKVIILVAILHPPSDLIYQMLFKHEHWRINLSGQPELNMNKCYLWLKKEMQILFTCYNLPVVRKTRSSRVGKKVR